MSLIREEPAPGAASGLGPAPRSNRRYRIWLYLAVLLVAMSATRLLTGADDITSAGTLQAAMIAAIPIAMAGLGGLWSERAGIINIGLEGMMILGTLGAGFYAFHYGVWAGLLGAAVFGAVGGALHALATVTFGVDHIVSGVAINIIALGVASFLAEALFTGLPGGGPTQSPSLPPVPTMTIPGISDVTRDVADQGWFVVSDLASVLNALTAQISVFTLIGIALIIGTAWLLWHSPFGLRLRSCGESPSAAETLGVNVLRYKFVAVTMSGLFAGIGGAYLAMVASSGYQNGQTGGRGYIGLAAMIFGNWRPAGMFTGSLLFGYTDAARLRSGGESVHALLLILGVALLAIAVWQLVRGSKVMALTGAVIGVLTLLWYFSTERVSGEFTAMTPYVTTLLVLALASQQLRVPRAIGRSYRRGEAG